MKIKNEIKIGAISILAFVLGYIGLNYLKGINLFNKEYVYYVRLKDLGGANVASPVLISGYKVGAVRAVDFQYHEGEGYSAVLTLNLNPKVNIPRGSHLRIKTNMLRGAELILSPDTVLGGYYANGDTIPAVELGPDIMAVATEQVLPTLVDMLPELHKTIVRLNEIVANRAIDSSLINLHATTTQIQAMMSQVNRSMNHLPEVMANARQLTASMAAVGKHAESIRLDSVMHNLNVATDNLRLISAQLRSQEGTAGKLLGDPSLYNRLDSLASSADALLRDLKANPKRYVRFSVF